MFKNIARIATILFVVSVFTEASTTALNGTSGAYTLAGDDKYGMGAIFVKGANFLSDGGLNKIVGIGAGIGSLVLLNAGRFGQGAMVAMIAMAVGFFPKIVDGLYN